MKDIVQTIRLPRDLVRDLEGLRPRFGNASRAALIRLAAQDLVRRHDTASPGAD